MAWSAPFNQSERNSMQTEILKVRGISGEGCADKVSNALMAVKGVSDVTVSLAGRNATVQFEEGKTSLQELQAVLIGAGYGIESVSQGEVKSGGCCGGCGGGRQG
jgi:copper chaperone CopZ